MKSRKTASGEITVFFALILTMIISLLFMILESAATQGRRLYLTVAANSAVDSLFSQYHRKLWEEYRLLGLEHYALDQISDEMRGFMDPYFEAENWYPMKTESIQVTDLRLLTDDGAEYFEKEVLDYMKYGICASVWDMTEALAFSEGITEGGSVSGLSDIYDGHTAEAVRLEETIGRITALSDELKTLHAEGMSALNSNDGYGFISRAEQMQRLLGGFAPLSEEYERKADKMEKGLQDSKNRLNEELNSGRISSGTWERMNEDVSEYESYVAEDGERRAEISGLPVRARSVVEELDSLIAEAEDIESYISSWEPEDEDDELDEAALWRPVLQQFSCIDLLEIGCRDGIRDRETEKKLEGIKKLLSSSFLKMVLPEGAEVSTELLKMEERPSEEYCAGESGGGTDLADRIFLTQYIADFTDYFGRGSYDRESRGTGSGHFETEYVLFGKSSDQENLSIAVKRLIEIRTGLNLLYLYSDTEKRAEARALAMSIAGAFGMTPLTAVVAFTVMSIWALGQAVCDVRDLLAGERVSFMHDRQSFYLTVEGLLAMASGNAAVPENRSRRGMKYIDYLKMLLFSLYSTDLDYRCMDVIQMCIGKEQQDFRMRRMIYSAELLAEVRTRHLFSELLPSEFRNTAGSAASGGDTVGTAAGQIVSGGNTGVDDIGVGDTGGYLMRVPTSYSY